MTGTIPLVTCTRVQCKRGESATPLGQSIQAGRQVCRQVYIFYIAGCQRELNDDNIPGTEAALAAADVASAACVSGHTLIINIYIFPPAMGMAHKTTSTTTTTTTHYTADTFKSGRFFHRKESCSPHKRRRKDTRRGVT